MSISHTQAFEEGPDKLTVIKFIKRFVIGLLFEEDIVQINKKGRCEEVFFSRRLFHATFQVLKDILRRQKRIISLWFWTFFMMLCDNVSAFY